ncbi:hypothetical protein GCM10028807_57020 [Spirosoma daeguense]
METTKKLDDEIPPLRRGRSYKPEDIKRWGVERFFDAVIPKTPFTRQFPDFTEEENRRMDELLAEGDRGA